MALDDRLSDLLVDWELSQRDGREPTLEELCKDAPELLPVVRESIDSLKATRWMLEPTSGETWGEDGEPDESRAALHDTELPASHLTVEQFAASIFQSGLLSAAEIDELNRRLTVSHLPGEAREVASKLVTEGKLTRYQASVLLKASKDPLLIDNYVILDTLDTGGMGLVFKALHRSMNRVVALKLLPAAMMGARDTVKRFQREVQAAAALSHPNIVAAYDAHQSDEIAYLVLEYVEGINLFRLVKEQGPLPVAVAANYVRQAATGLAYLHSRGLIHRDVKPANLILAADGTVKLLDMGLVRFASSEDLSCAEMDQELTQAGIVIGTVAYMSPEQALDTRSADQRSDIYSLGCTLFFLLTGRSLYHEETGMKTLLAHREQPVPTIREFCEEAPVSLDAVYRTMVAKRPADRLQTMNEIVAALDACVPGLALNSPASMPPRRVASTTGSVGSRRVRGWHRLRSSPLRMAVAIAVLVGVAAGGTYLAGILIQIKTKQGITEVRVDDPDAEVTVKRQGDNSKAFQSLIIGKKSRASLSPSKTSDTKTAEPLAQEPAAAIPLVADWIAKKRKRQSNENQPAGAPASADTNESVDGQVAKWLLDNQPGTQIWLREMRSRAVNPNNDSLSGNIHIEGITYPANAPLRLQSDDIERLASLSDLKWLNLPSPSVTDAIVVRLTKLTKLTRLSLSHTSITDDCLPALAAMTRLSSLDLSRTARITDAGLSRLAAFKSLNNPRLVREDQRNRADWRMDPETRPLPSLVLDDTQATEAGVLTLQQALPNCAIFASHIYPGNSISRLPLPPKPGSSDREWAIWLLSHNSPLNCWLRTDLDPETVITKREDLPPIDFHIHTLGFGPYDSPILSGLNAFFFRRLGELRHLSAVHINQRVGARTLQGLVGIKSLQTVFIGDTNADDEVLQALAPLTALTTLTFEGSQITDAGLKSLAPLKGLRELSLGDRASNLHGTGLAALSLTQLRTLNLGRSALDDDGAREIGRLTGLERLDLWDTWISGKGLAELANLKHLKTLKLAHCRRLRADDFAALGALSALEQLDLSDCRITDASFDRLLGTLKKLKNLRTLNLNGTGVTRRNMVPELELMLPRLNITWPAAAYAAQQQIAGSLSDAQPTPSDSKPSAPAKWFAGVKPRRPVSTSGITALSKPIDLSSVDRVVAKWVLKQPKSYVSFRDLPSRVFTSREGLPPGDIHIQGITILHDPKLRPLPFDSGDIERLASLSELEWLNLPLRSVTDDVVLRLKPLTKLTRLMLASADITDVCLPALTGMTRLSALDLRSTKITDVGLEQLAKIKSLNDLTLGHQNQRNGAVWGGDPSGQPFPTLVLDGTQTTEAGVLKLQQALPNCVVFASHIYPGSTSSGASLPPKLGSSDVEWANWLLSHSSGCWVRTDLDPETTITKAQNLPPVDFHIEELGLVPAGNGTFPDTNAFLLRRLGDLTRLRALDIHANFSRSGRPKALEGLRAVKSLKTLVLSYISADDESLQPLSHLTGLTTLVVDGDQITDAGLKSLAPLKELTRLTLNGRARRLHGSGFEALSGLTGLRTLELAGSGLDDEGARHVGRLTGLEKLDLHDTWISRKGLEALTGLKHLRTLNLAHCRRLQGDDFAALGDFSALEHLDLSQCRITDASCDKLAEALKKLKNLRTLNLIGTSVSMRRFPAIRVRPELEIKLSQPNTIEVSPGSN